MSREAVRSAGSGANARDAGALAAPVWRAVAITWLLAAVLSSLIDIALSALLDRVHIEMIVARALIIPALVAIPMSWRSRRALAAQLRNAEVLRDLVRRDQQTGLLHHNAFIEDASRALTRTDARVLLIGDIDRFKSINDSCGHLIGDQVILAVGDVVRDLFERTSITGRIGGEEFAVLMLMPFADRVAAHHAALAFAQEWRKRIEQLRVPGVPFPISISIGLARSASGETFDSLYARADRALYVAKTSGRNRVCADEHEPGPLDDAWPMEPSAEVTWIEDGVADGAGDGADGLATPPAAPIGDEQAPARRSVGRF